MTKTDQLFKDIINRQLAPHGVTYDDVVQDKGWLHRYRFASESDYKAWREWSINEIRTRMRWPKYRAQREFEMLDLGYGLSILTDVVE